jgi:hypothetical protein
VKEEAPKEKRKKDIKPEPKKSRSRSREDETKFEKKLVKEKENLRKQWDTTNTFTEDQNNKFMRLMGGFKGAFEASAGGEKKGADDGDCKRIDHEVIQKNQKMTEDLERSFQTGMQRRLGLGGGLGFGS